MSQTQKTDACFINKKVSTRRMEFIKEKGNQKRSRGREAGGQNSKEKIRQEDANDY